MAVNPKININYIPDLSMAIGFFWAKDSRPGAKKSLDHWLSERNSQMPLSDKAANKLQRIYDLHEPDRVAYLLNMAMDDVTKPFYHRKHIANTIDRAQQHSPTPLEKNPVYHQYLKTIDAEYKLHIHGKIKSILAEIPENLERTRYPTDQYMWSTKEALRNAWNEAETIASKLFLGVKTVALFHKYAMCKSAFKRS